MPIKLKVYANSDDAILAWKPDPWPDTIVGFQIERRDIHTGQVSLLNNRIPPSADLAEVPPEGIASDLSPIRRCMWTDHGIDTGSKVEYRITPMIQNGAALKALDDGASAWEQAATGDGAQAGDVAAWFNRGTLMSQVVSRMVGGDVSAKSLKALRVKLEDPGFPGRRYLSGQARHAMLDFLAKADTAGNSICAAIYEINDQELIEALKVFGARAQIIIGNGSSTGPGVANDLESAGVKVSHRDLSHKGESSPSVHNKFVVELDKDKKALRVLTGSTNWTTTGVCTQLNNVLVLNRPGTADRFHRQWRMLQEAGDDMPPELRASNSKPFDDGNVTTWFAATTKEAEFAPVLDAIAKAKQGILFLMFTPGDSPLLNTLLGRVKANDGLYVRGVVSTVTTSKNSKIEAQKAQVISNDAPDGTFHQEVLVPDGETSKNLPPWALEEFQRRLYLSAHLNAIIHSKTIVIDPFSDDCVVVTGSHNFSPAASKSNDENLVIIRGDRALAQAYAVHAEGIYDHFSWRAFLSNGGDPASIYKPVSSWKEGNRARELAFWLTGD